jgi:hypothetical protein
MDLSKFEERFSLGSFVIFIALLILITKSNVSLFQTEFPSIAYAVLLLPIAILAIYYISQINTSVLSHYKNFRNIKEKEIELLRKKEKSEIDVKKRMSYITEISNMLVAIADFQDNRLTRQIFISFIFLVGATLSTVIDIGQYIDISNWVVTFSLFYYGLYKSIKSLSDIIISKK